MADLGNLLQVNRYLRHSQHLFGSVFSICKFTDLNDGVTGSFLLAFNIL